MIERLLDAEAVIYRTFRWLEDHPAITWPVLGALFILLACL